MYFYDCNAQAGALYESKNKNNNYDLRILKSVNVLSKLSLKSFLYRKGNNFKSFVKLIARFLNVRVSACISKIQNKPRRHDVSKIYPSIPPPPP